jgi:hypothetical protein
LPKNRRGSRAGKRIHPGVSQPIDGAGLNRLFSRSPWHGHPAHDLRVRGVSPVQTGRMPVTRIPWAGCPCHSALPRPNLNPG